MALTSSVEVSGSPWQLYNGAGLIQSQGRMVGLAETHRENWSGSEIDSSRSSCVVAATCSVTEEKTFCLHSNPILHPLLISSLFFLPCSSLNVFPLHVPLTLVPQRSHLPLPLFIHPLFRDYLLFSWLHLLHFFPFALSFLSLSSLFNQYLIHSQHPPANPPSLAPSLSFSHSDSGTW